MNSSTIRYLFTGLFMLLVLLINTTFSLAQEKEKMFVDTLDNAVDLSKFLNSVTGFLPVPNVITEPALGVGGALGILYFHKKKSKYEESKYGLLPPVMTMAIGGATSNKSRFGIVGHIGSYKQDRFRYMGILGLINVNLSFFGAGIIVEERAYNFNAKGWFTVQEFLMRVNRELPFFIGANYVYFGNTLKFKVDSDLPIFDKLETATNTAGLNSVFLWDSRDNTFTPNTGILAAMDLGIFNRALGGDNNYGNINVRAYGYSNKILPKTVAGLRLATQAKWGDPAFYELPYIALRGIPVMRYQDNVVSIAETEIRYNIWKRWSLLGFTGVGFTSPDYKSFSFDSAKASYGGGFRYFLARQYRIHAGIDIARGPEDWAWYIVVGSNWRR